MPRESRKSSARTDWDFYPEEIAREIIQDDRSVIESGQPIVNKLEVIVNEAGRLLWVLPTKTPARSRDGRICGVMGLTRPVGTTDLLPEGYRQFSRCRPCRGTLPDLAGSLGAGADRLPLGEPVPQALREAVQDLAVEFINRIRVQTARACCSPARSRSRRSPCNAASATRSYFTRQFSHFFGLTPKRYRDRLGKRGTAA